MFPLSFKAGGFKKHSPDQDARAEDARLLSVTWRRKGWLRWQLGQSRLSERRDVVMGHMCCAQEVIFFQGIMMIHIFDKIQIFEVIYATENLVEILYLPEASSVSGSALSGAISTN